MVQIRIFNSTFHPPTPEQKAAGVGPPHGREVPLESSFDEIRQLAAEMVAEAVEAEAGAVLIGGLSSLAIAIHEAARARGLGVVEAVTERIQDNNGRFIFKDKGLRWIEPPSQGGE